MVLSVVPESDLALRASSGEALARLCAWASVALDAPLPWDVRRRAALVLIDDIGAAVAAMHEPEVVRARAVEVAASKTPEASIFVPGTAKLDRIAAATANGMAATWAELDEGYRLAPCHAGAYIWPALVAEAEVTGASTETVLSALAIAYDITARFARAYPFATRTVHPHAAFATIGAAAGIGILRRLDSAMLLSAITGAASMTFAGPYGHALDGALVRNAWTAAGTYVGFRSVDWAAAGIGGIPETGYDVFSTCFGTNCRPEELDQQLGSEWAIRDGYHKIFACCQYAHSMVEAALDLHQRLGPGAGRSVAAIEVETHPRGLTLTNTEPPTVLSAKFSMPHAAAAVARLGTGGQVAFSGATLVDPSIAELRRRVTLMPLDVIEPWPNDRAARLTWIMDDGVRHTSFCRNARGGADQPFDETTLVAKLRENTRGTFPQMAGILSGLLDSAGGDRSWKNVVAAATGSA